MMRSPGAGAARHEASRGRVPGSQFCLPKGFLGRGWSSPPTIPPAFRCGRQVPVPGPSRPPPFPRTASSTGRSWASSWAAPCCSSPRASRTRSRRRRVRASQRVAVWSSCLFPRQPIQASGNEATRVSGKCRRDNRITSSHYALSFRDIHLLQRKLYSYFLPSFVRMRPQGGKGFGFRATPGTTQTHPTPTSPV